MLKLEPVRSVVFNYSRISIFFHLQIRDIHLFIVLNWKKSRSLFLEIIQFIKVPLPMFWDYRIFCFYIKTFTNNFELTKKQKKWKYIRILNLLKMGFTLELWMQHTRLTNSQVTLIIHCTTKRIYLQFCDFSPSHNFLYTTYIWENEISLVVNLNFEQKDVWKQKY